MRFLSYHKRLNFRVKKWGQVLLASCLSLGFPLLAAEPNLTEKQSLVSIDFCADQYLLALAERSRIQAVSFEAVGPRSFYGLRAEGLPTVNGSVEELIQMQPSLVLRTWRGGARAVKILEQLSIPTYTPTFFMSVEQGFNVVTETAKILNEEAAGKALISGYKTRLSALNAATKYTLKAVYMTPSGFTAGTGTYVNDIIHLAGFETMADEIGLMGWAPLPLEKVALTPPDFVIATFFGDPDVHVSHWSGGRHGVYKKLMGDLPVIDVPSSYLSCSGLFAVDAAEYIRAEAVRLGLIKRDAGD